jgi:SAM-dependent methyltransferase
MRNHYGQKFEEHGPTSKGVDWGKEEDVKIRYDKMLAVIDEGDLSGEAPVSLLDVGCGFGGLFAYAKDKSIILDYTGIDVCENMIRYATDNVNDAKFYCEDILESRTDLTFDYVVCNGILTQKLSVGIKDMDRYAHLLIRRMYELCNKGIAFNIMTTKVNFMVDNLYYRNPVELFGYCFSEITNKIRIDHAYPLYEYTMYLYKE